ncbi:MAG: acyl-CoA dehydrogenase family protein, partial [Alphaproteobacteria bacterium]
MFMEVMTKRAIEFLDEQAMMLDAAKRFVADKSPIAKVRELIESDAGFEADIWAECAQLGWAGMAVPEEFGGSAFGLGAVVPVVEMMGRGLMSTPLVPTVLAGAVLTQAGADAQKAAYLPKIAEGAIATLALSEADGGWGLADMTATASANGDSVALSGTKALVEHADKADIIIASVSLDGKPALVILEKADLA